MAKGEFFCKRLEGNEIVRTGYAPLTSKSCLMQTPYGNLVVLDWGRGFSPPHTEVGLYAGQRKADGGLAIMTNNVPPEQQQAVSELLQQRGYTEHIVFL